jgi:hypothetical protein
MNRPDVTLSLFAEHMRLANPFDDNRVTQVDSLVGDVPQINRQAFERLIVQAEKTCRSDNGRGVVVSGSPGIGKSHLLARFGQWARAEKYPFVYLLNLQAGPDDILRTILRTTISILTRDFAKVPATCRLYKIVSMAVKEANNRYAPGKLLTINQCRRAYGKMLQDQHYTGEIYQVLWHLFEDIQRGQLNLPRTFLAPLAIRWLSGDYVDAEDSARLGVNLATVTEEGPALSTEEMKDVLRVLCEFTACRNRCFILCFDQVDTLSEEQVRIWSATVHALLDSCPGLLVVTSGVDETFLRWASGQLVSKASWDDRIRQFPVLLSGIDAGSAKQLILGRLQRSCKPFESVRELAALQSADESFPIGRSALDSILREQDGSERNDMRPRDVISRAGMAWDRQASKIHSQGLDHWLQSWNTVSPLAVSPLAVSPLAVSGNDGLGADADQAELSVRVETIDEVIERRIREHQEARRRHPEELPVDAGNLTGLVTSLLKACTSLPLPISDREEGSLRSFRSGEAKGSARPPFQLILEYQQVSSSVAHKTGVVIAEASSGNSATHMLKRILAGLQTPGLVDSVLLIVDERSPLTLAAVGQERLQELQAMGSRFSVYTLSFKEYAALDALVSVVGLANAGDLTVVGFDGNHTSVSEAEVYQSHYRTGRYLTSGLLNQLTSLRLLASSADVA